MSAPEKGKAALQSAKKALWGLKKHRFAAGELIKFRDLEIKGLLAHCGGSYSDHP